MTATWQPAPILFPNAEKVLPAAYRVALAAAGETVATSLPVPANAIVVDRKVPSPIPARLVAITRDGGTTEGLVDRPRMRFRIYDTTEEKVDDLARLVLALAQRLVANGTVTSAVPQSGPYDIPDESAKPMRYLLIEFHTRGTAL